jgi:hypothetical protein
MDAGRNDPAGEPDGDDPELAEAEVRRSRPARDVLRVLVGEAATAEITKTPVDAAPCLARSPRIAKSDAGYCLLRLEGFHAPGTAVLRSARILLLSVTPRNLTCRLRSLWAALTKGVVRRYFQ